MLKLYDPDSGRSYQVANWDECLKRIDDDMESKNHPNYWRLYLTPLSFVPEAVKEKDIECLINVPRGFIDYILANAESDASLFLKFDSLFVIHKISRYLYSLIKIQLFGEKQ